MEAAPLSLAHAHARNAVVEIQKANPIAASEEHDLAAGEFANAAKSTGDPEALRTLRLLEQHHVRLAELLKYKPEIPTVSEEPLDQRTEDGQPAGLSTVVEEGGGTSSKSATGDSPRHATKYASSSETRHRRELSSSIANNLASARGIQPKSSRRNLQSPASPVASAHNADGHIATSDDRKDLSRRMSRGYDRRSQAQHSPVPPYKSSPTTSQPSRVSPTRSGVATIPPSIVQPGTDDAFTRFYSTVESFGTKISAALAFTGLPLGSPTSETSPSSPVASEKQHPPSLPRDKSRTTPSGSPDVSRFFSRAALKAVREDGGGPGVAESFYVVPTSGGTITYAGMLQGPKHGSNLSEAGGEDEFVDASEVPVHGSFEGDNTGAGRRSRNRAGSLRSGPGNLNASIGKTTGNKTENEVRRELEYWKAMAMETGERLKAFEMNAQRESIMASIYRVGGARSRHHSPESVRGGPTAATDSPPPVPKLPANLNRTSTGATVPDLSDGVKDQKIKELEDEIERAKEEIKRCTKENRKLMAVVEKYRKRFEDLKENARERMRVQEEKAKAQQAMEDEEKRKDQMMS